MPKFLTSGAQKLMANFIESSGVKGAVYDEEMTLLWTNYPEFFDNFDIGKINGESPLISESAFSAEADGVRAVLNITPVYKSPRVISAYVCIIREAYDIYKMMNKTVISDFSDNIMRKNRDRLEKLAELNRAIGEAAADSADLNGADGANRLNELNDLVKKQEELLLSMRNETRFYIDTCFNEVSEKACNISLLFSTVCEYAAKSFKELGRKVSFTVEEKDYYINSDDGSLLIGFLHLLRSHVMLSPPKTAVSVTAAFEPLTGGTGLFVVKVKTSLLPSEKIGEELLLSSRAYGELAKKVVMYDYGGLFERCDSKKNMQTVFKIPAARKNRGPMFRSEKSCYEGVALTYLRDIIYCENNGDTVI